MELSVEGARAAAATDSRICSVHATWDRVEASILDLRKLGGFARPEERRDKLVRGQTKS